MEPRCSLYLTCRDIRTKEKKGHLTKQLKPFSVLTPRNESCNIFPDDVCKTKSTTELEDTEAPEPGEPVVIKDRDREERRGRGRRRGQHGLQSDRKTGYSMMFAFETNIYGP